MLKELTKKIVRPVKNCKSGKVSQIDGRQTDRQTDGVTDNAITIRRAFRIVEKIMKGKS